MRVLIPLGVVLLPSMELICIADYTSRKHIDDLYVIATRNQACPVRVHVEQIPHTRSLSYVKRCPRVDTVSLLAAH